jgi:predicted PurR-regulated permease PerM
MFMATEVVRPSQEQPLRLRPSVPPNSGSTMPVVLVIAVAALYLGREILIPLALSVLLSFALAPATTHLRRWGLRRVPSALLVVFFVFILVAGFATVVTNQMTSLAQNLSRYEYNFRAKIRIVEEVARGEGTLTQLKRVWEDIQAELEKSVQAPRTTNEQRTPPAGTSPPPAPIPVEVHQPPANPVEIVGEFAGGMLRPLATAGIIVVFVIFFLVEREDMRDRLIRLFGSEDVHRTTEAMTDAAKRVSRYLIMQVSVNSFYGVMTGIGLWLIGVPHPLLWGLLAAVLRFIPYIGPAMAAGMPIIVAIAVDPDWTMPLLTAALFVTLEAFINNVLEPWLYGSSTGLSPIAILFAAVFWTTLWGPVGLLLSTPLTVCLVVLGRHFPQLRFLEVLLGSESVLPSDVKVYQRLLAGDPDEAYQVVEEYREENILQDLYDRVLIPVLAFADQDRVRGALERYRWIGLAENVREIVKDLRAETSGSDAEPGDTPRSGAGRESDQRPIVICIGGRNDLDAVAAEMLAHLFENRGLEARVLPNGPVSANLGTMPRDRVELVCFSYVNPGALHHARRSIRAIRRAIPRGVPVILGLWNGSTAGDELRDARERTGADEVATSLAGAIRYAEHVLRSASGTAAAASSTAA